MAGDPRTLGNAGLRPEEIVDGEVLAKLGKRFQKASNREWRKGTNPMRGKRERMQVRCYWYKQTADGLLVPVKQLTTSRVVDRVEWVAGPNGPAGGPKWIRGWVVWGRGLELEEVRKEIGDRYWKMIRLVDPADLPLGKSRLLGWGQAVDWETGIGKDWEK